MPNANEILMINPLNLYYCSSTVNYCGSEYADNITNVQKERTTSLSKQTGFSLHLEMQFTREKVKKKRKSWENSIFILPGF